MRTYQIDVDFTIEATTDSITKDELKRRLEAALHEAALKVLNPHTEQAQNISEWDLIVRVDRA